MIELNFLKGFIDQLNTIVEVDDTPLQDVPEEALVTVTEAYFTKEMKDAWAKEIQQSFKESNTTPEMMEQLQIAVHKQIAEAFASYDFSKMHSAKKKIIEIAFEVLTEVIDQACGDYNLSDAVIGIELIHPGAKLPTYANPGDQGADVYAPTDFSIPGNPYLKGDYLEETPISIKIPLGFKMRIPDGWAIEVRPRSGLSLKTCMRLSNSVGTIDTHYRGEVCLLIDNLSPYTIHITKGDRLAQLILVKNYAASFMQIDNVNAEGNSQRGESGFGDSGT